MINPLKRRNAYAVPAQARKNAGAMTHRNPPRLRLVPEMEERTCRGCGDLLDPDDTWTVCVSCAVERALPSH